MPCLAVRILMAAYRLGTYPKLLAQMASLEAAVDLCPYNHRALFSYRQPSKQQTTRTKSKQSNAGDFMQKGH